MKRVFKLVQFGVLENHSPLYFTLSDSAFSPRTLSMVRSLRSFDDNSPFLFFHFDDLTQNQLSKFIQEGVQVISIPSFLGQQEFNSIESTRSHIEFMWTLPSVISRKLTEKYFESTISDVVYLDADLFFYASPENIWQEIPSGKISIVRHNFSDRLRVAFPNSGEFNVSWVSFPTNAQGIRCASMWARDCISLCPSIPTLVNGNLVYGDQLYLEKWPKEFSDSLHIIENIGAGVAPWNYENYYFQKKGMIFVDGVPLIFYHFSSHQFGFFLASKIGRVYKQVKKIPRSVYKIYEISLKRSAIDLGFKKWRSRHRPLSRRGLDFLSRFFE